MKIGIITYHRSHNYGAVLQAYGTKTALTALGHDADIIDYWPDYRKGMYDLLDFSFFKKADMSLVAKLKRSVFVLLALPKRSVRYNKFQDFISNKLGVKGPIKYTTGDKISTGYDAYVFGSDQVWRYNTYPLHKGFDEVYWGKYPVNAQKITYAASMGTIEMDKSREDFIKKNFGNFKSVSVREDSLKETITSIIPDAKITQVLDPTFLVSKTDWLKIIPASGKKSAKKYVLFYNLIKSQEAFNLVDRIAAKFGYDIIELNGVVNPLEFSSRYAQTTGPIDFLSLIAQSEFVVSTSFHGVAFSIIFEKQFYALGMKNNSGRVASLLTSLTIPDRLVDNITPDLDVRIDYNEVNKKLDALREQSINFLKTELK